MDITSGESKRSKRGEKLGKRGRQHLFGKNGKDGQVDEKLLCKSYKKAMKNKKKKKKMVNRCEDIFF